MKHLLLTLSITLLTATLPSCDSTPPVRPLSIGDQMPLLRVNIAINSTSKEAVFVSSKGKLLILEFISTWCGTCRESVPHLQKLQQSFPNDLQIILVTHQEDSLVRAVAKKHQWSLPIITEDSTLSRFFPYQTVPHQVWIKNRKVQAITNWQYANEENIRKLLAGEQVKTNLKKEAFIDLTQPLITAGRQPYYQSIISPRISYGSGIRKIGNQFLMYNADISELYRFAYDMPAFPRGAYILLDVGDSIRQLITGPGTHITGYFQDDSTFLAWREQFTFCYKLTYPENAPFPEIQLYNAMQQDLNRFFASYLGIKGAVEKRAIKCLALIATDDLARFATTGGKPYLAKNSEDYQVINKPISLLISQISYRHHLLGMPVINATGYSGNVDLEIKGGLGNLEKVNQGLEKYGLRFVEQEHEMDLVVIKEVLPSGGDAQRAEGASLNPKRPLRGQGRPARDHKNLKIKT